MQALADAMSTASRPAVFHSVVPPVLSTTQTIGAADGTVHNKEYIQVLLNVRMQLISLRLADEDFVRNN
jgi:hypothetical protein